jgi:hypothetical protein
MSTSLKTSKTQESVNDFINQVSDIQKREDAKILDQLFQKVTGQKPAMWGPSMIGYGKMTGYQDLQKELAILGKHTTGKGCLYIKKT